MDNSRIEVYKIICGNKTFRQIAIEKNEGIDQAMIMKCSTAFFPFS